MRKVSTIVLLVLMLTLAMVLPASAHVHGITPLGECSVVPAHAGANQTNVTPAASTNGGPITGLIPRDVGEAPLTGGDGGRNAPVQCP
jgi:hypothetical protein